MKRRKIAFIISSFEIGGAEKMLLNLTEHINKDLYQIKVFIIKKNYQTVYDKTLQNLNIEFVYLNKKTKIFFDFITTIKLTKHLKDFKPDIIHSHLKSSSFVILYKLINKKVIWIHTIHTLAAIDTKYIRRWVIRYLYGKHLIIPVAVSNNVKESAKSLYRLKDDDIYVVYNGVDIKNFSNTDKIYNDSLVITHIGRFEKVKNHRYIINEFYKFFKINPMARLNLIGDGPLINKIKALVKSLGLSTVVKFTGFCPNVFLYLKKTDIFVLPSLYEGLSMSLIEAMASGCAIIASDVGGNKELVSNYESGLLIENKPNQLFEKIVYLDNRREVLYEMGQNNIQKANNFSVEKMVASYQSIYETV